MIEPPNDIKSEKALLGSILLDPQLSFPKVTLSQDDFYEETLGFTPNSLFTMMHRPRIANAFVEMNQAVMENKGRVTSALKREIDCMPRAEEKNF